MYSAGHVQALAMPAAKCNLCMSVCVPGPGTDTRCMLDMVQAKGQGYAMSKQSELEVMQQVAASTGLCTPYIPMVVR